MRGCLYPPSVFSSVPPRGPRRTAPDGDRRGPLARAGSGTAVNAATCDAARVQCRRSLTCCVSQLCVSHAPRDGEIRHESGIDIINAKYSRRLNIITRLSLDCVGSWALAARTSVHERRGVSCAVYDASDTAAEASAALLKGATESS